MSTKIEWTEETWNPVTGCTRISEGCDHCYIERTPPFRMAHRKFDGGGIGSTTGVMLHEDRLSWPLHWRKPRRIFVCSLADLFHEDVPDEYIARVWAAMALAPQHTFQCLTKRPARMRSLLSSPAFKHQLAQAIDAMRVDMEYNASEVWRPIPGFEQYEASTDGRIRRGGNVLSPLTNPRTGRHALSLWVNNVPKTMPVHRLILLAHDPEGRFDGAEVCHRNGDKRDNRRVNLRWGTRSENQLEKVRHGSRGGPQRITAEIAQRIRSARAEGRTQQSIADEFNISRPLVSMIESGKVWAEPDLAWPLPNVWLGVSTESQKWADIRIPLLLDTPAAVRWISAEPLLGPVRLAPEWLAPAGAACWSPGYEPDSQDHAALAAIGRAALRQVRADRGEPVPTYLDWVVAGGETGPGSRPMHPDWARSLRDQCAAAGVPYFHKQWGDWAPLCPLHEAADESNYDEVDNGHMDAVGLEVRGYEVAQLEPDGEVVDPEERQAVDGTWLMARVGKKRAGRELDGRTHDEYPAGEAS